MNSPKPLLLTIFVLHFVCLLSVSSNVAFAHTSEEHSPESRIDEREETSSQEPISIVITPSRGQDLLGVAESASEGRVGEEIFESRPLLRPGEIIETVTGMVATQHSGTGKANQYFFRGFNLDHGTDFRTDVDGMPVNLVTHGHGQGYTDLNFLIPELVDYVDFKKGTYFAEKGNFATAGSAEFFLKHRAPKSLAKITLGEDNYGRGLYIGSNEAGDGVLLYGLELLHSDGPWVNDENSKKVNAVLRYSHSDQKDSFSATAMVYRGQWDSTDQIPLRAVEQGLISSFDTIDPTVGGDSNRFSVSASWDRVGDSGDYRANAYGIYYDLDLYSNFTYFLEDPQRGDQFHQEDQRGIFGGEFVGEHDFQLSSIQNKVAYGVQLRHDRIDKVGLHRTQARERISTVRQDEVDETHIGVFLKNSFRANSWLRGSFGVRGDFAYVDVASDRSENSGSAHDTQVSPKAGLIFGPWANTELYLNGGFGFHSNDARGATTRVDPNTEEATAPVDLLTRARGAEFGVRTSLVSNLVTTVNLWYLDLDSELVFVGDAGNTEAVGASERHGVEINNFYQATDWLSLYLDYSYADAKFQENTGMGDRIPNSIEHVLTSGWAIESEEGWKVSGKWRYLGTRPLVEDESVKAPVTSLVDLRFGRAKDDIEFYIDIFNVFDEDDYDIAYFYGSRLNNEAPGGVEDTHFHPVEPRTVRASISYSF